jgi:hypothetical protein
MYRGSAMHLEYRPRHLWIGAPYEWRVPGELH